MEMLGPEKQRDLREAVWKSREVPVKGLPSLPRAPLSKWPETRK